MNVAFRRETQQPVVVEKDPQRIAGRHQHIDAHVTLEAVDQERFVEILLDDHRLVLRNLIRVLVQGNSGRIKEIRLAILPEFFVCLSRLWLYISFQLAAHRLQFIVF